MASDIFLKIDGIKGESQDKAHKGEIDVLAWTFGTQNSGLFQIGSGGGVGKAEVRDIKLEKYVDSASAEIFKHVLTGKHIETAKLTVRKAGDSPFEFLAITLKKVLLSAFTTGAETYGEIPREVLVLNFAELKFEYDSQNEKGGKGEHYAFSFDVAQNATI
jgi:type VI secretion system secreted protein Hcp